MRKKLVKTKIVTNFIYVSLFLDAIVFFVSQISNVREIYLDKYLEKAKCVGIC